jgi:hypothetical protein
MGVMQTLRGAWVLRALIVVVFALRAVVPAGYMLANVGKSASLVLCTAQGSISVSIDPATGHVTILKKAPGQAPDRDDPPCAFGAVAKVAFNASSVADFGPAERIAQFVAPDPGLAPGTGLSAPPPPATGPPSSIV